MMFQSPHRRITNLVLAWLIPTVAVAEPPAGHSQTRWRIEPSFKYDALCLVNILTGDPFYLRYYFADYGTLAPSLSPEAQSALKNLTQKIKTDGQRIISAWLCLMFSAVDDRTIDDMLQTLDRPETLKRNMDQTTFASESGWQLFESIREDLRIVLTWMKQADVEQHWKEHGLPKIEKRIAEIRAHLDDYNVIPLVEAHLGAPLPTDEIVVYMLYFSQPHGIRVTGNRFLTDAAWPFKITARTAAHELMHPPYQLENDAELLAAIESLRRDPFLMDKVENHNPSFGYLTLDGFVEEDCVQALDQLINEKLGLADDPRTRWRTNDDGMHVLAVALYQIMKSENYPVRQETFRDYFLRTINEGKLHAGQIKKWHEKMYAPSTPQE